MDSIKKCILLLYLFVLAGCGGMTDDLHPSGSDKRPFVEPGTTGYHVGQKAPDFTIPDSLGTSVNLSTELTGTTIKGVVIYFTMWCSYCDGDMDQMKKSIIPSFPDVVFFAVDYVSETVAQVEIEASRYAGSGFRVLADIGHHVADSYHATMETTVVIDKSGVIRMNEDFKDGTRLYNALLEL